MKIGIYGYGNIGKGVECAIAQNPDMEVAGVFTRRDPATVKTVLGAPVYAAGRQPQRTPCSGLRCTLRLTSCSSRTRST